MMQSLTRQLQVGPQEPGLASDHRVWGLGQVGGVGYRKRHIEDAREGLGKQGFSAPRRPDEKNVGLGQLNIILFVFWFGIYPFVMIVHRYRERLFRLVLTDNVVI